MAVVPAPRISWTVQASAGWTQRAARVRLDGAEVAHLDGPESLFLAWPFAELAPGSRHRLEVAVVGNDGTVSDWSPAIEIDAMFRLRVWTAQLIGAPAPDAPARPVVLRREFDAGAELSRATLFATAHGVYQAAVNGVDVDDHVLKPGWTAYAGRLAHETTDVTALVRPGGNVLTVRLAGGWFTERYGFGASARRFYGEQPALAAELHLRYSDGRTEVIATDESWRASVDGPMVASGIYAGETVDLRRADADGHTPGGGARWQPVRTEPLPLIPEAVDVEPVRRIEEVAPVAVHTTPSGRTVLDFGQNLVGRLRLTVTAPAGTRLTLRHAEVLEHGELCVRALRAAEATDRVTLPGGTVTFEPEFTFHGFRYAEVTGWPGEVDPEAVRAVVLHTDVTRTGWFRSSDPRLNRLHENVVWSMRGNIVALPTDCPQRDERLGWTGDAQVFAPAACGLFDVDALLTSWCADLAVEQSRHGGLVPTVVPDPLPELGGVAAAGWGDAATIVPSVLHERYADRDVLARQYDSMRTWVDHEVAAAGPDLLWERGFQYGDWLDPTASRPDKAKADPGLVATAYLVRSARLVAEAAGVLGDVASAALYGDIARRAQLAFGRAYITPGGRLMSDAPTAYALAIAFDLAADAALREHFGERLAFLLRAGGYRMATGFLGTPLVVDALLDTGQLLAAERLLLQTESPSWLHPLSLGATTMWERWDSLLPDGTVNPSGMTSFNHYALGSVADVLHRRVGGLAPTAPGYRRLRIEPWFVSALDHAEVTHDTPLGRAVVGWRRTPSGVDVHAVVPAGARADVVFPDRAAFEVGSGRHAWTVADPPRGSRAPLGVDDDLAVIADAEGACALVSRMLAAHDADLAREFDAFARWVPGRSLRAELAAVAPPAPIVVAIDSALRELTSPR